MEKEDAGGWRPIHWACWNGHAAVVRLLLDRGDQVEIADRFGQRPIHLACGNGHAVVVRLLLDRGAQMEIADWFGQRPIHWACWNGHAAVVQLLLDRGAQMGAADGRNLWELPQAQSGFYTQGLSQEGHVGYRRSIERPKVKIESDLKRSEPLSRQRSKYELQSANLWELPQAHSGFYTQGLSEEWHVGYRRSIEGSKASSKIESAIKRYEPFSPWSSKYELQSAVAFDEHEGKDSAYAESCWPQSSFFHVLTHKKPDHDNIFLYHFSDHILAVSDRDILAQATEFIRSAVPHAEVPIVICCHKNVRAQRCLHQNKVAVRVLSSKQTCREYVVVDRHGTVGDLSSVIQETTGCHVEFLWKNQTISKGEKMEDLWTDRNSELIFEMKGDDDGSVCQQSQSEYEKVTVELSDDDSRCGTYFPQLFNALLPPGARLTVVFQTFFAVLRTCIENRLPGQLKRDDELYLKQRWVLLRDCFWDHFGETGNPLCLPQQTELVARSRRIVVRSKRKYSVGWVPNSSAFSMQQLISNGFVTTQSATKADRILVLPRTDNGTTVGHLKLQIASHIDACCRIVLMNKFRFFDDDEHIDGIDDVIHYVTVHGSENITKIEILQRDASWTMWKCKFKDDPAQILVKEVNFKTGKEFSLVTDLIVTANLGEHERIAQFERIFEEERRYSKNYTTIYLQMKQNHQETLSLHLDSVGPLPEEQITFLSRQILEGLHHLHNSGIVHRNVCGRSIFLDENRNVKLTDLGSAAFLNADSGKIEDKYDTPVTSSFKWTAPEVLMDHGRYCPASDVWSFGAVVVEMITGSPPFDDHMEYDAVLKITQGHIIPYNSPHPLTDELKCSVDSCFQFDPHQRRSCAQLLSSDVWKRH